MALAFIRRDVPRHVAANVGSVEQVPKGRRYFPTAGLATGERKRWERVTQAAGNLRRMGGVHGIRKMSRFGNL